MAEAVVSQINGAVSGNVATKSDIELVQSEIERLRVATKSDIERLGASTKSDIERLEASTKSDIERLKASTKSDIERLEASTKSEFEHLEAFTKSEFELVRKDIEYLATKEEVKDLIIDIQKQMNSQMRWIVGSVFGAAGLLFAALKLFG